MRRRRRRWSLYSNYIQQPLHHCSSFLWYNQMSCVRYKSKLLFCYLKKRHQLISLCYIIKEDFRKTSVSDNVAHPWALFWYSPGVAKISMKVLNSITHPYTRITMRTSQPCSKNANRYTIRFRIFTVITTHYLKNGVHIFQAHYMQFRQCSYASNVLT